MKELLHSFGVEWNVLLVQAVNVAVLVFLLQKFALKPLLRAIDARREKIADDERRSKELSARMSEIEQQSEGIIAAARSRSQEIIAEGDAAARAAAERTRAAAEADAAALLRKGQSALAEERARIARDVTAGIGEVVAEAVKKAVGDAFDETAASRIASAARSDIAARAEKIR